ncbi:addiction module antidote protein [Bordetella genomosp. 13]|uniref:Putative addiction module antidote protein n=1 Tax=Bordetella genomosp. 13 TaxID=463040 RepID=A0A1W6Z964_9BORD|nr:addiction module antidote protein [Bordetella genomosp. 13]ARP93923.1 putative addiction module antidote protein [Bordetella genomosp. 13]
MNATTLREWDSAEYLKTDEDMVLYLEACMEEAGDDAAFIAKALGNIARAKGMTQLAKETGLGRESLYKALSGEGNPSFATILKVTRALGIKLHPQAATP